MERARQEREELVGWCNRRGVAAFCLLAAPFQQDETEGR
jgi:hypothetical protein